jgi:hypothetical protein
MSPGNRKSWWSGVALVLPLVTLLGGCRGEEAKVEQAIVRPGQGCCSRRSGPRASNNLFRGSEAED